MKLGFNLGLVLQVLLTKFFCSSVAVFSCCLLFLVPFIPIRIDLGWECGLHSSTCSGSTCLNWILWHTPLVPQVEQAWLLSEFSCRHRLHRLLIVCIIDTTSSHISPSFILVSSSSFASTQTRDAACCFSATCSWSMCSNWMFSLVSNSFVVAARNRYCLLDLGDLGILNSTYPRVLSFRGVVLKYLRGIFFPERRHLVEIHLQIVCRFLRQLVSLACLRI